MSKIKITLQVSAGYGYALILKQDGSLYGIGDNSSGQICDSSQRQISPPAPVAAHVKAFAAGCNYSIYVTESGEVKLAGNGKYTERFSGFQNAQDVYARSDENVLIIHPVICTEQKVRIRLCNIAEESVGYTANAIAKHIKR